VGTAVGLPPDGGARMASPADLSMLHLAPPGKWQRRASYRIGI
jgi:hypothetical protein